MAFEIEPVGGVHGPGARAGTPEAEDGAVTPAELRKLLRLNRATYYRWQKLGKFKRLELHLGERVRKRYSRKLVTALLAGETVGFRRSA